MLQKVHCKSPRFERVQLKKKRMLALKKKGPERAKANMQILVPADEIWIPGFNMLGEGRGGGRIEEGRRNTAAPHAKSTPIFRRVE